MCSGRAKVGGLETREEIPILSNLTNLIFVPAIAGQTPENRVGVGLWCLKRISRRQQCRSWTWDKRTSPPKQQILTSERQKRVRNDTSFCYFTKTVKSMKINTFSPKKPLKLACVNFGAIGMRGAFSGRCPMPGRRPRWAKVACAPRPRRFCYQALGCAVGHCFF